MRVGELSPRELAGLLAGPGWLLEVGPFVTRLTSDVGLLAGQFHWFYAHYPFHALEEWGEVVDFHIALERAGGVRRWWRPQVRFRVEESYPFAPFPLDHAYPYFEWGLNWRIATRAHHFLMFHAAALEKAGRVLLLPGRPGSGKSTLAAALALRGWRLFSDEFALLRPETGRVAAMPRPLPLKNASIAAIQQFAPEAELGPLFPHTRKGSVRHVRPAPVHLTALGQAAPVAWVVCPRFQAGSGVVVERLPPRKAFYRLAVNAFNYEVGGEAAFRAVARLARGCPAHTLRFGRLDEAVAAIEALTAPPALGASPPLAQEEGDEWLAGERGISPRDFGLEEGP